MSASYPCNQRGLFEDDEATNAFVDDHTRHIADHELRHAHLLPHSTTQPTSDRVKAYIAEVSNMAFVDSDSERENDLSNPATSQAQCVPNPREAFKRIADALCHRPQTPPNNPPSISPPQTSPSRTAEASEAPLIAVADAIYLRGISRELYDFARKKVCGSSGMRSESDLTASSESSEDDTGEYIEIVDGAELYPVVDEKPDKIRREIALENKMPATDLIFGWKPFYECNGACGTIVEKGGIHSFACIRNDSELTKPMGWAVALDPRKVTRYSEDGSKTSLEILLKSWMEAHRLTWASGGGKKCTHHKASVKAPVCHLQHGTRYRCPKHGCQRTFPKDGPLGDNYNKLTFVNRFKILFAWVEGVKCKEAGCDETRRKFQTRFESVLATWMLHHKVRLDSAYRRAQIAANPEKETDHVEVDETFFSKPKYGKGRMRRSTFMLETLAVVNKLGETVDFACAPIFRKSWYHLRVLIRDNVPPWRTPVFTDGWAGYIRLKGTHVHRTVNHKKTFVSKEGVSTNNIEGFHSHIKRAIAARGYANTKNSVRAFRILSGCGLALSKLRNSEYHGNSAVWVFQAIASVVSQGQSMTSDPEADKKAYYEKLIAAARAEQTRAAEAARRAEVEDAKEEKALGKRGRPPGSKNKKPTAALLAARMAGEAALKATGKEISKKDLAESERVAREVHEKNTQLVALIATRDMCRLYFAMKSRRNKRELDARHNATAAIGTLARERADADMTEVIAGEMFVSDIAARNAARENLRALIRFSVTNPGIVAAKYKGESLYSSEEYERFCKSDGEVEGEVEGGEDSDCAREEKPKKKSRAERKIEKALRKERRKRDREEKQRANDDDERYGEL